MTLENNCFSCDGQEYRKYHCDCYAVNSKDRVCVYRKVADNDLVKLEKGIPAINLYQSMKDFFSHTNDSVQLGDLEKLMQRKSK